MAAVVSNGFARRQPNLHLVVSALRFEAAGVCMLTVTVQRRFRLRTRHHSRYYKRQAMARIHRLQNEAWQYTGASFCHGACLRPAAALIQTLEDGTFCLCPLSWATN